MSEKNKREIDILIRARYPLIYIVSYEEERVEEVIGDIAKQRAKSLYTWSVTRGLYCISEGKKLKDDTTDPLIALNEVINLFEPSIFIFKDFHPYLTDASIIRKLREAGQNLKTTYKTIIILSPILKIPVELEKDITVVDFDLPKLKDLNKLLLNIISDLKDVPKVKINLDEETKEKILHAALGLTLKEAENVFAKALVQDSKLSAEDISIILSEKQQIVRKSGILEYIGAEESIKDVGGLEILKEFLAKRGLAFSEKAKEFGLPSPKGVLLIGVQGCGKSLCAKAVSSLWNLPLLRLDVGKVFSSLVGSSEENVRRAIKIAETVSPAILWIDEIEKAFSGMHSSSFSDAGTTSRVFAHFITWLQEKESPVFVVATANNISLLPPELLRKGRFDEIFFVDLPKTSERKEIFAIHLRKRERNPEEFDLHQLAEKSAGFSGAEIEQVIISSLFDVFYQQVPLSTEIILKNLKRSIPLSKTMSEEIESLRKWAKGRARFASPQEDEIEIEKKGKIEL